MTHFCSTYNLPGYQYAFLSDQQQRDSILYIPVYRCIQVVSSYTLFPQLGLENAWNSKVSTHI